MNKEIDKLWKQMGRVECGKHQWFLMVYLDKKNKMVIYQLNCIFYNLAGEFLLAIWVVLRYWSMLTLNWLSFFRFIISFSFPVLTDSIPGDLFLLDRSVEVINSICLSGSLFLFLRYLQ